MKSLVDSFHSSRKRHLGYSMYEGSFLYLIGIMDTEVRAYEGEFGKRVSFVSLGGQYRTLTSWQ